MKVYYDGKWNDKYQALIEPVKGQIAGDQWNIVAWSNALTYGPIFSEDVVPLYSKINKKIVLINGDKDITAPKEDGRKRESQEIRRL